MAHHKAGQRFLEGPSVADAASQICLISSVPIASTRIVRASVMQM